MAQIDSLVKLALWSREQKIKAYNAIQLRSVSKMHLTKQPIDSHFICATCDDVVLEPLKCLHCERLFCQLCEKRCSQYRETGLGKYEREILNQTEFECGKCQDRFLYEF